MTLTTPSECLVQGNPDLYGIGVRAGLYTQWTATLLATLFDPSSESTLRIANLIIQASIFLGLCTQSSPGDSLVGALITQYLLFGSLASLTGNGISHLANFSGALHVLFYLALSAYGVWFWFRGVDLMSDPGCPEVVFFGEISVHGWFRTLGKVVSVLGLVLCVVLVGYSAYALFRRFEKGFKRPERTRPQVEIAFLTLSMGLIAASIVLVEHLVVINQIEVDEGDNGVGSVGQLIPLLVGGLGCFLSLWKVVVHRLFLRKRCWFLFGYHL